MSIYHHDFYTWTHEQAALLKEGRLDELDIEHLIEELEDLVQVHTTFFAIACLRCSSGANYCKQTPVKLH